MSFRQNPYQCTHCEKSYKYKCHLMNHLEIHKVKPYQCSQCDDTFADSSSHLIHLSTHVGEKSFKCNHCDKAFFQNIHLINHLRTHDSVSPYKCFQCDKTFSKINELLAHMTTHAGEKPYQCTQCYKSFSQKRVLLTHLKTHTGSKSYMCNQCFKTFSKITAFKEHLKIHTGENLYQCSHCDKYFTQKRYLKQHMKRSHSGEKPYNCSQCNKTFSVKHYLIQHGKTHIEKTYSCSQCGKEFSCNNKLLRHLRTHTSEKSYKKPYHCSQCNTRFSLQKSLTKHQMTCNEKSYNCSQCGKEFSQKIDLIRHNMKHTAEKTYKCDHCNKIFSRNSTLIQHLRTHNKKTYKFTKSQYMKINGMLFRINQKTCSEQGRKDENSKQTLKLCDSKVTESSKHLSYPVTGDIKDKTYNASTTNSNYELEYKNKLDAHRTITPLLPSVNYYIQTSADITPKKIQISPEQTFLKIPRHITSTISEIIDIPLEYLKSSITQNLKEKSVEDNITALCLKKEIFEVNNTEVKERINNDQSSELNVVIKDEFMNSDKGIIDNYSIMKVEIKEEPEEFYNCDIGNVNETKCELEQNQLDF